MTGGKVAEIGRAKLAVKLASELQAGVFRNRLMIYDVSGVGRMGDPNLFGQIFDHDPTNQTFQLYDTVRGTPYYRLSITSEGRITFGGSGSPQAEISTSISELHQLRNTQLDGCGIYAKNDKFFVLVMQGGAPSLYPLMSGILFFESDCMGKLLGDRPGWLPVGLSPHPGIPGAEDVQPDWRKSNFRRVRSLSSCQQASNDGLRWLTP